MNDLTVVRQAAESQIIHANSGCVGAGDPFIGRSAALARLVLALTENTGHYPFPKLFRKAALARCAREIEDGVDPATDRVGSRNTVAKAKESE